MNTRYHYELNKLIPLQRFNELTLTAEQKAVQHQKAKAAPRKPKTVDYLTIPEASLTELPSLYTQKYNDTPGNHPFRLDLYRLFLHIIYNTHRNNLESQEEYFPLHSQILRTVLGKDKGQADYATIRKDLVEWDFIEFDDVYSYNSAADIARGIVKDVFCKSYRLTERIRKGSFVSYRAKGIKYAQKTEKGLQGKTTAILDNASQPQYTWLKANLARLRISQDAYTWIQQQQACKAPLKDKQIRTPQGWKKFTNRYVSEEVATSYRTTVAEFNNRHEDGNPAFSIADTNNRLQSGLTNLASGLRSFIAVDGIQEDLMYVDLSSSQVFLLLPLLQSTKAVRASNGKEFEQFKALAQGAHFYTDLVSLMEAKHPEFKAEGDAKVNFFKFVVYSNTHKAYGFRKYFNNLFPTVNAAILELVSKARDKEEGLAVMLQKQESSLFLDSICTRLYQQLGPQAFVATLHDGIICEAQDFDTVYNTMLEVLTEETGYKPNLKADNFQHAKPKTKTIPMYPNTTPDENWLVQAVLSPLSFEAVAQQFLATDEEETATQLEVRALLAHWLPRSVGAGEPRLQLARIAEQPHPSQLLAA